MLPIERWKAGQPPSAKHLNQAVDGIIALSPALPSGVPADSSAMVRAVLVYVGSAKVGKGLYEGTMFLAPKSLAIDTATDLTLAALGEDGEAVTVANMNEIGSTANHWLTNTENTNQKLFHGYLTSIEDEAGRPVVVINGFWAKAC